MNTSLPIRIVPVGFGSSYLPAVKEMFLHFADHMHARSRNETPGRDFSDRIRAEARTLPGKYYPLSGSLLAALYGDRPAGCVGICPVAEDSEIKRLWVEPNFRGYKISNRLIAEGIEEARNIGSQRVWVESINGFMEQLHLTLGFEPASLQEIRDVFGRHYELTAEQIEQYALTLPRGASFMKLRLQKLTNCS